MAPDGRQPVPVPSVFRFVSPERRWRAACMLLPAAYFGWRLYVYLGIAAGCLVAAGILSLAVPILRTCLLVTDEGLLDRRLFRTVRVPWAQVAELRVGRPGGPWGGFCVIADCRDGTQVDLLSTRAYTRLPSAHHLDELIRLSWTLEELVAAHRQNLPPGP